MGRELRMVPANWEHPKNDCGRYQPMFGRPYKDEINEWIKNHRLWEKGEHPNQNKEYKYFAEWDGDAPRVEYYRPDWNENEMTWFQVYETVSEGTPVTPPFETKEELVEYLVENGDFWDQERRKEGRSALFGMPCDPWERKTAENFVYGSGWAPSLAVVNGKIMSGVQGLSETKPDTTCTRDD